MLAFILDVLCTKHTVLWVALCHVIYNVKTVQTAQGARRQILLLVKSVFSDEVNSHESLFVNIIVTKFTVD